VLVFRNARLGDAVREFNRYNQSKLVIADPAIADLKFTIEIKSDNFDGFVRVAQTLLNVRADRRGKDVYLSRQASEKKTRGAVRSKRGQ
jgi:transmembrane sensor